ncbi:hypothetical protein ACFVS2_21555 [Brevibacillus sp. NPDC058079]|uniref:hypothetical protein n=1 Tax=Brevibacillus sp. NPDC058079 TaxID=3346330 RepID=UPI0036E2E6F9
MCDQLITFHSNNESVEKLTLQLLANKMLEKSEVHYLDLTSDSNRINALLPECYYYDNEDAFSSFLTKTKSDLSNRLSLYKNGRSLDGHSYVTVIVSDLQSDANILSFSNVIAPYMSYHRAVQYSFIVKGFDLKIELKSEYTK